MTDQRTYTVGRAAEIAAPPEHVYAQVVDLRRWTTWSPWEDLDPALQRTYSGPEQGVGSTYAWKGNRKAGQGRMEITRASEPDTVVVAVRFLKPFRSSSTSTFAFAPAGEGTRVSWTMTGPTTFSTRLMGLFTSMDKLIGPDFEKGLARLKAVCEAPSPA